MAQPPAAEIHAHAEAERLTSAFQSTLIPFARNASWTTVRLRASSSSQQDLERSTASH